MLFKKNKPEEKYKVKGLAAYAMDRALGQKKKFRRVFERAEITYLGVELSLYNKLFDEEDWEAELKLKANRLLPDGTTEVVCEKTKSISVSKDENVFRYAFGWGDDERGSFWTVGNYEWEAEIDGDFVESAAFYIEEGGRVSANKNPYLEVLSLRTYEAPDGDREPDDRVYLKSFDVKTTRYIMAELRFKSLIQQDWKCELFFNYYDDTGLLVGVSDSFFQVTPESGDGNEFTVTAGWGGAKAGTWIEDHYTLEVTFMETLIALIPFSIGDKEQKRLSDYEALLNEEVNSIFNDTLEVKKSNEELNTGKPDNEETEAGEKKDSTDEEENTEIWVDDRPVKELLSELDALIGLKEIKTQVREYIDYVAFLQVRESNGIVEDDPISLHSVFTGNPGTGKTTVVKLLGSIYHAMGLLTKGHVHTVEANDLISGFVRQSGKDTKDAIEKARGGILFVDEAYMLFKEGASNDFGPEAIAALITEMSDGPGDIAIMVAGYPKEMDSFINSNPGLRSRFKRKFHFKDYKPDELLQIARLAAKKKRVSISDGAEKELVKIITEAYRKRDRTFGNARFAVSLIDEAKLNLGIRIMKEENPEKVSPKILSTLLAEDIEDVSRQDEQDRLVIPIDEELLLEAQQELDQLSGIENIKQEVRELIKLSRYYREINRDVLRAFSLHSVFMGNPGTGKTTVARIMAKVYKALGMLERGHLIEADGSDMEAGFVGQTALKTKDLIAKAMGGVLFIDEAYSITDGQHSDFGKKAIAALIKEMEDHRGEFGVIVAGYTQNMEEFIRSNPGIQSRFDQRFMFKDFSETELWLIASGMLKQRGLVPSEEAEAHLKEYIAFLYQNRDKFFGNARSIRKVIETAARNQELRMADIPKKQRTDRILSTLSVDDVKEFVPGKAKTGRPAMGFRL